MIHFDAGKGDSPRPRTCTEQEYTAWYCRNFGCQFRRGKCRNCGDPQGTFACPQCGLDTPHFHVSGIADNRHTS